MTNGTEWNVYNCIVYTELPQNMFLSLAVFQVCKCIICCNFSNKYDGTLGLSDFQFWSKDWGIVMSTVRHGYVFLLCFVCVLCMWQFWLGWATETWSLSYNIKSCIKIIFFWGITRRLVKIKKPTFQDLLLVPSSGLMMCMTEALKSK
jgi:hypothetical protein